MGAFKDFYDQKLLDRMAGAVAGAYPAFDAEGFRGLMPRLKSLEMKPRVQLLREELRARLPQDYKKALAIVLKAAKSGKLESFDLWPLSDFVQTYGLEDPKLSLEALKELTGLFSSEFAVRPFIKRYPKQTMAFLEKCARDESVDVRRWASEGSRPRLPWGERLQEFVADPSSTLPILEALKFDEELYVRKSVANHLNDISKDHPALVIKILAAWKNAAGDKHAKKIEWIIHRSLRTLIKAGYPGALKLIGVGGEAKVKVSALKLNAPRFKLGDRLMFGFRLTSFATKPQKIVVDYIVHFVKANKGTAPKVFKLKTFTLPANKELAIAKSHHLKRVTTRTYYPGVHLLEIQVNGRVVSRVRWELV